MKSKKEKNDQAVGTVDRLQQIAAKTAGSLFLCLIVLYFAEELLTSQIESLQAKRMTELIIDVIYIVCAVLLAISLYLILKPVNKKLSLTAMFLRLGESLIVVIMMILNLKGKAYTNGFYISAILFSIGSLLFFFLFYKSKYIPDMLSVFGLLASVLITLLGFAVFLFPEYSDVMQLGWVPILIAEITTAGWLLFKGLSRVHSILRS